jgi:hypothetical protein
METPAGYARLEHDMWLFECERCGCAVSNAEKHDLKCTKGLPFGLEADEVRFNAWTGSNKVQVIHLPTGTVIVGRGNGSYEKNKTAALYELKERLRARQ